ncbi:unnamed protein product [Cunninghamella echinulata]
MAGYMNPTSGTASTRSTLLSVEDQYNKRIDDDISKLITEKDKFKVYQEGYQIESQAAQIVRSTESLFGLIKELKQYLLLNDTSALMRREEERSEELVGQTTEIKQKILDLRKEITSAIYEMESVYYRSLTD